MRRKMKKEKKRKRRKRSQPVRTSTIHEQKKNKRNYF